ncbi:MAG: tetratricopeptide repeat protein, partial [Thermoanaerobaculia bacterium]
AKLAALGYLGGGDGGGSGADPKDHIAEIDRLFRASTLAAEGKPDEAIAILEELVRENPRLTDAWTRLGALHQERGETAAAIAAFRRAIEAAPQLAREHALTLANLYLETGELDLAREHAELGVTAHPGTARVLLAAIAAGDGRLDEALRLLDEAETAANGPLFGLDAIRGDVLARLGRGEEAEAAFARELRNFPENRDAYAKLALLYAATGRLDRARGILEILVRADPSPAARSLAANTLEAVGDAEGAARFR